MGLKRWSEFCYIKILLLLCTCGFVLADHICTPGLNMPGYTVPQGDIVLLYGKPLDIMCVVNVDNTTNNNTSRSLSFKRNNHKIPSAMIDIVNSTAIKFHIDEPPLASGDMYSCLLNVNTSVCMNRVTVGLKPQKVTDFNCISYNFDNLTCEWTAPQNYIRTNYSLTIKLGSHRSSRFSMDCPSITEGPNNRRSCFWNVSTTPQYRQVHETYYYNLTMENVFGKNEANGSFNHWAHVLSGPPENLTVHSTTPSSIYLSWVVPLSMQTFVPGVEHRVLYQCESDTTKFNYADVRALNTKPKANTVYYNLTNLKYAHDLCDIRVALRSAKALPNDESMWSRNASITCRTSSKIPDNPPETDVGGFEIVAFGNRVQFREAFIYWKQVPEKQRNGPDFGYNITVEGDSSITPVEVTNTYAKFNELLISKNYTFHIWSKNQKGLSLKRSTVYVPRQIDRVREPVSFTKVELSDGEYELTWEPPKLSPGQYITNYTIFSCSNDRDRPYQCNGQLNWIVVPRENRTRTISVEKNKIFQFAISANTHNSSSGMLWAACTIIHNKNMGKMKNVWINRVGSTFIEVGWKLECSDQIGSVEGYIVYYCPIKSPTQTECKGPQANSTFLGSTVSRGNLTELKPYTTYMMSVAVITKNSTYSQQSDPLYNTTLEATPTPPRNLRVVNVTNTTISVEWMAPEAANGIIRYYLLEYYKGKEYYSIQESKKVEHAYSFVISQLMGYENYTITIQACTGTCSTKVETTAVTKMGHPSKILKPTVDRRNDTSITITWRRPSEPAGRNDYYIVRFRQKYKHGNETAYYNTTARKYVIENCGNGGKFNAFYISVRAINKDGKDIYEGPWSDELENYCSTPINYIMYLLLFFAIAGLAGIGFLFTRLYHRCKIMRDVEVKLPPGLAPVVADHTLVPWNTEKDLERRTSHAPPDEELLLVKMNEGRHFSGDSSGCSSGHESVTSSLESGTHISSSSDSGTEQPVNYCGLGVEPKEDSSYIPVSADTDSMPYKTCGVSNESSPYVMTGEVVKTVNPGYIPFSQTEPAEKSSSYVVAGIKNINGYIPFNPTENLNRNTGYVVAGVKNCKLD